MRWTSPVVLAVAGLGCAEEVVCTTEVITLEVEVLGLGDPPVTAEVVAYNVGTHAAERFTVTDGRAFITEAIGPGDFRLWAEDDDGIVSDTFMVRWTCDACHCTPGTRSLALSMP